MCLGWTLLYTFNPSFFALLQGLTREQEVNGVSCRDDLEGELTSSQKPHPATKAAVSARRICKQNYFLSTSSRFLQELGPSDRFSILVG